MKKGKFVKRLLFVLCLVVAGFLGAYINSVASDAMADDSVNISYGGTGYSTDSIFQTVDYYHWTYNNYISLRYDSYAEAQESMTYVLNKIKEYGRLPANMHHYKHDYGHTWERSGYHGTALVYDKNLVIYLAWEHQYRTRE